jgi:hypothetical protein
MKKQLKKGRRKSEEGRSKAIFLLSCVLFLSFLSLLISSPAFGAWFGQEDCSSHGNVNTGYADAMRFQAPENGTSARLEIRSGPGGGGSTIRLAVYSDSAGHPKNRLWEGTNITYYSDQWLGEDVTTIQITQNAYYWFAFKVSATVDICYQTGGPSGSHEWKSGQSYANPFPDPWSYYSGYNSTRWTMRMQYTSTGAGESKPRRRRIIISEFPDSSPMDPNLDLQTPDVRPQTGLYNQYINGVMTYEKITFLFQSQSKSQSYWNR